MPDLQATGGIQHYSRALLRALAELMPECPLSVLSKNDRGSGSATGGFALSGREHLRCFGGVPTTLRTAAFALGGWWAAYVEKPAWAISTHPHFSKALRINKATLGVPYLCVTHGVETWGQMEGRLRQGLLAADRIISVSRFTRRHLVEACGFPPEQVMVVPNTFDETLFATGDKPRLLLERHGLHAGQPVLLTVGRMSASERYKGHEHVIRAMPVIQKRLPEVRYVIVGSGDDVPRLREICRDTGVMDAVIFAGHVPREELPAYHRLGDVFVMPSTGEGFGIVFLEALASGRPVIAANADASPEALDGGRLGWLVDPARPDLIAEGAIALLEKHTRPELADPEWLRAEVIRLFGFAAFKESLRRALGEKRKES